MAELWPGPQRSVEVWEGLGPWVSSSTSPQEVGSFYSHVASRTPSMCSRSFVGMSRAIPELVRQHALTYSCATVLQVTSAASLAIGAI